MADFHKTFISAGLFGGVWELVWAILMFVVVLVLAYFTTKLIGKTRGGNVGILGKGRNLEVVEGCAVGAGAFIQIARVGADAESCRYYLIGVTKEHITFLAEIEAAGLSLESAAASPFSNIFSKLMNKENKETDDNAKGLGDKD